MMNKTVNSACYHCGSALTLNDAYSIDLGGVARLFCCVGCMAIAQTIHGEGLEVFYARRARKISSNFLAATVVVMSSVPTPKFALVVICISISVEMNETLSPCFLKSRLAKIGSV